MPKINSIAASKPSSATGFKSAAFTLLLFTVLLIGKAQGAQIADRCEEEKRRFESQGSVSKLKNSFQTCSDPERNLRFGIRTFTKNKIPYAMLVDPQRFRTSVLPLSCLKCKDAEPEAWPDAPYIAALRRTAAPPYPLENKGATHAEHPVTGVFVTVDLCPTNAGVFAQDLFEGLEKAKVEAADGVPVGVSVSGLWLKHHRKEFQWLREQERSKQLKLTWINHSYSHPFHESAPEEQDFLLRPGVHLEREILRTEALLLEVGAVPSVFFRFPGLVSGEKLILGLKSFSLIPLGSDAWLARRKPVSLAPILDGSIILVHGNGNERFGIDRFWKWFRSLPPKRLLPLEDLFRH